MNHSGQRRWTLRAAPLALALLLTAGCGEDEAAAGRAKAAPPTPTVVVADVKRETVPVLRDFVARTEAKDTVAVQARVEALLESMHFEEGKPVEKGAVLFELDKSTYEANVAVAKATLMRAEAMLKLAREQVSVRAAEASLVQAKASLKKAQQDVARLRPLAEEDAVPRQDLDTALASQEVAEAEVEAQQAKLHNSKIQEEVGILEAEAALKGAKAALELAELDLGYCTIACPIDGLIGRIAVSVGNLVGRGEATELATVSSIDPMYVTFAVSEAEYLGFVGMRKDKGEEKKDAGPISLILADDSIYAHQGKTVTVERVVSQETGTLTLVAEFPNPEGLLRDGQFGRVRAVVATLKDAVTVPQRSVMDQQGAKVVLIVGADNVVALKTVHTSVRHGDRFVIVDGLEGGEKVIVEGQMKARPGSPVKPTDKPISKEPTDEPKKDEAK
jgi:membrane fusion protein, multidrug efflux system